MTQPSFCADRSRALNESPIGTASQHQTYVLIECPTPWAAMAQESRKIPAVLGQVMQTMTQEHPSVQFLLINRNMTQLRGCQSVIIYRQKPGFFCAGYDKYEFVVSGLIDAAGAIETFFANHLNYPMVFDRTADVLICTHGSHDRCCARHGNPFYAQARQLEDSLDPGTIRVWRSSHFGGHRFAPTAITFPDGRYYARLTITALRSIVLKTGDINLLSEMYRGWGMLPSPLQVMEQALFLRFGWRWREQAIAATVLSTDPATQQIRALLQYIEAREMINCYGDLSIDPDRSVTLQPSCHADWPKLYQKYQLDRLELEVQPQPLIVS